MKILVMVKILYNLKIEPHQQNGMLCFEYLSLVINPLDKEVIMVAVEL